MTPIGPHLTAFLREYIPSQREMSVQTSDTYAYAFQLLVCFAAERLKTTPSALSIEQLDATLVLAFLEHLETNRGNCARTRNSRLAAIKTFFRFLEYRLPSCLEQARRIRAIPVKKTDEVIIGYLNREEIQALLDAPDPNCQWGLRDRAMLHLAFVGGLRVSELVGLNLGDLAFHPQPTVHVMGKGRRERVLPLWKETVIVLRDWLKVRGEPKATALFLNARGDVMTRSGFEYILGKARSHGRHQAGFASQKAGISAQSEAFVRHAHSARNRRHSKGLSLARPRNPPKHRGLSESRSHRKVGGHGVFGSAELTTRSLPAAG